MRSRLVVASVPVRAAIHMLAIAACALVAACGRDAVEPSANLFALRFEEVWTRFDLNYPMFAYKRVDWRKQRDQLLPRARGARTQAELVQVLAQMEAPLHDGHLHFTSPDGTILQVDSLADRPSNWDKNTWSAYVGRAGWHQGVRNWGWARFGDVGYVAIGSFDPAQVRASAIDSALDQLRDTRALILDVRMNGGGNSAISDSVAARFADTRYVYGYEQFRVGPQHDQLGPLIALYLSPRGWRYDRPVYVLAGRRCFSSTERFVLAMRLLPQVTILGDTTGGSTGNPGTYDLGDGWSYSMSRSPLITLDHHIVEDVGIAPSLLVKATPADFAQGIDPVLDVALARAGKP